VEVVVAVREFEAWFLAGLGAANSETVRDAKGEFAAMEGISYRETIHQARYAARLDLDVAYTTSRSFRRLVSAVGALVQVV
jgi:hypothetical protein